MKNSRLLKNAVAFLGLIISIFIVWYILGKYDLQSAWESVKSVSIHSIVIMIVIYLSTFLLRAWRWKLMLSDITDANFILLFKSIVLGFAGNNIIPARGGELLRMEYVSRRKGLSRATTLTSIGLEKILDGLVLLSILLVCSLFISKSNEMLDSLIKIVSLVFIPAIFFVIILKFKGNSLIGYLDKKEGKIIKFASGLIRKFIDALGFIKPDFNSVKVLALSTIIWLVEGIVFVLGMISVGIESQYVLLGFTALCVVNFGILIPSSPGYIGVFQAAVILALTTMGIEKNNSLAVAIIIHACQFFPTTFSGFIVIVYDYYKLKKTKYNY